MDAGIAVMARMREIAKLLGNVALASSVVEMIAVV